MEKEVPPPSPGHASLYHASNPANPSDVEYAFTSNHTSAPNHSVGIGLALDNADIGLDGEAPPAYQTVSIEGGNISAEVMRMPDLARLWQTLLLMILTRKWPDQHAHRLIRADSRTSTEKWATAQSSTRRPVAELCGF